MPEYLLPDVGEGLTEAEIVSWKVTVGDVVAINDIVVEIETAKSLVELPSPYAGTVSALLVAEGDTVPVGTPIIAIGEPAAAEAPPAPVSGGEVIDTNIPPEGHPTLVGYGPREVVAMRRPRLGSASPRAESAAATQMQVQGAFSPGGAQSQAVLEYD
ncbi:biotin/lipoyl-containing protein [Nocardioides sp.]|uniref:biotin/lipoyl-containing protein n=1 Tax=Nocardioides sp. TaxID=35761 RepID=UPI002D1FBDEB|nr:biotin/lipoyl-containing protein [Nocardioides sp.]